MRVFVTKAVADATGKEAEKIKNRSLLADKYAYFTDKTGEDKQAKDDHAAAKRKNVERLCQATGFEEGPALAPRRAALANLPNARAFVAKLGARMIINQSGGVMENAGIALDRNSGVPFIPGSAVKGIARVGAAWSGASPAEIALVFGWAKNRNKEPDLPEKLPVNNFAGTVSFLPAFPTGTVKVEADILTSHHANYYSGETRFATDDESPNPVIFPTVGAGTEFQFVLLDTSAPRTTGLFEEIEIKKPVELARQWLLAGLTGHGLGAKTAAGYGWFSYDENRDKERQESRRKQAEIARAKEEERLEMERQMAAASPAELLKIRIGGLNENEFAEFAKNLAGKQPDEQRAFFVLLRSEKQKRDWWKMKNKKVPELAAEIRKVAKALGENFP